MKPEFKYLPDVWRVYHFVNLKFTVVRAATPFSLLLPSFSPPFSPFRFSILLNLPIVSMGLFVLSARDFFFLLPLCFLFLNVARLARYAEPSVLFLLSRLCFSCVTSVTLHCVLDFLSLSLSFIYLNYRWNRLRFPDSSVSPRSISVSSRSDAADVARSFSLGRFSRSPRFPLEEERSAF